MTKNFRNFQLGIGFFLTFQKKSRMFQIIRNLFCLKFIWAKFEQDFFRKKRPLLEGVFEKKSKNFRIFQKACDKSFSDLAQNSLRWSSDKLNVRNFGTFALFFEKVLKKLISSLKFGQISNLKLDFFKLFQKKSRMFQNCAHLFTLNFIWANFEQDQSTFFFEKTGLS